jgi:hypothetical protein
MLLSVRCFQVDVPLAVARLVQAMQTVQEPLQSGLLAYTMLLWNDALVFLLGCEWLALKLAGPPYNAETADIEAELGRLSERVPQVRKWALATHRKVATNYLNLLRDCSYATGTARKHLRRPFIAPDVVMNFTLQKLETLRSRLLDPQRKGGALLVVYPPGDELIFRTGYEEIMQELHARDVALYVLNLRTLVFEVLEARGLLQKAFQLDAAGSREVRQNLEAMVQREALQRMHPAAQQALGSILCCTYTASLHPWISYSALLEETENIVSNTLMIPFPGNENGPVLHFLGVKDGYNYRAARI